MLSTSSTRVSSALQALRQIKTGVSRVGSSEKVYVAMSGGVDSSTTAALLSKLMGSSRVEGVYMSNWRPHARCSEDDWRSVERICESLRIDCRRVDLEREYWLDVFEPMISEYREGLTPNPDVGCNRHIKFGALADTLRRADPEFKWLATGHYVGLYPGQLVGRPDWRAKDQSYYLATVSSSLLSHAIFPLAHLSKPDVRAVARELLHPDVANKPDSQGLCFVEQTHRKFSNFLDEYVVPNPGPVVTFNGREVGSHNGLWTATIGQRSSIAMPQADQEMRGAWYVVEKRASDNALIIAPKDSPLLYSDVVECDNWVWHSRPSLDDKITIQYGSLKKPELVTRYESHNMKGIKVQLANARRAIAPGQYLVAYVNDSVVGAGAISRTRRS